MSFASIWRRAWRNGALLIIGATFFFTGMGACVKAASSSVPLFEIVFMRSMTSVMILAFFLRWRGVSYRAGNPLMLISRAVAGSLAICCNFYGLSHLSFGDATVLLLTFPVFVALLSFVFLGERPSPRLLVLIGIAWFGIALILKPQLDVVNFAGLVALLAAVFSSLDVVTVHLSTRTDHALRIAFYLVAGASLISFPLMLQNFVWPTPSAWVLLLGAGIFGTFAQILISQAYGLGEVSRLSPLSYISVVNAFVLGLIIWGEIPSWISLLGAGLIVLCCIFIARLEKTEPLLDE